MASDFDVPFEFTRSNTFKAKIREELICAICYDFLQEPKILGCAHSFCLVCLEKLVTSRSRFQYEPMGSDRTASDLECPSCREVTKLDETVHQLKNNFHLRRLVAIVSESDKKSARDLLKRRSASIHTIRGNSTKHCQHHHDKDVEYFCLDCNDLLCPRCISGSHRGHNFEDVDKVLPAQISALRNLIQPACEVANRAEGMIKKLFQEKDTVTKNGHDASENIRSYFKKVREVLNERESALRSTAQKYTDIRLSRIDAHYQMLENHHHTILTKISDIESLIDSNDNVKILRQKQASSEDLEEQVQSIMRLSDLLDESCRKGSLLFQKGQNATGFSDLGTLTERIQEDDATFFTLRRIIVSEEEDPYLDVPLRFEDEESVQPQKQMRVNESQQMVEYEPESKPAFDSSLYMSQLNTDYMLTDSPPMPTNNSPAARGKPLVPPRNCFSDIKNEVEPPLHSQSDTNHCSASKTNRQDQRNTLVAKGYNNVFQNQSIKVLTKSRTLPEMKEHSITNSDSEEDYDIFLVPTKPTPAPRMKRPPPLPPNYPTSTPPWPKHMPRNCSQTSTTDYQSHEQSETSLTIRKRSNTDIPKPTPAPCVEPPHLPSNYPTSIPPHRPKHMPRNRFQTSATDVQPLKQSETSQTIRKRSKTDYPAVPPRFDQNSGSRCHRINCMMDILSPKVLSSTVSVILPPLYIISNEMLSSTQSPETVYPNGVCCCTDLNDMLLVTDVRNHCLRRIDSRGQFIEKIGKEGRAGGEFKEPTAIAVVGDSYIYVSECDNPRIQKFTLEGKYVSKFGQKTLLGSQLRDPLGLAVSPDGLILVSDWDQNRVNVYSAQEKLVNIIGKENSIFKFPAGIAISTKGHILVVDRRNHCVWEIAFNGDLVQKIGSKGVSPGELLFPYGVLTLNEMVVVTDSGNNRVSVFSGNGKFIRCFGGYGSDPGQFDHPRHACVNSKGHLIVVDQMNQRLQVFQI